MYTIILKKTTKSPIAKWCKILLQSGAASKLQNSAKIITKWRITQENLLRYFRQNELVINLKPGKTETMIFGTCKRLKNAGGELEVLYNNVKIGFTKTYKYLGNILDSNMNFSLNFDVSYKKKRVGHVSWEQMRCYLTTQAARFVYLMMIVPFITAGCTLSPYNATQFAKLLSLDRRAKKIVGANDVLLHLKA